MNRLRSVILAGLAVFVVGLILFFHLASQEGAKIRVRYGDMTAALSSKNTNAILAMIAPQCRKEFDDLRLMRMERFAKAVGTGSKIVIVGKEATVWPNPNWYLCGIWPIGDTVEMTKVGGSWFFTGKVHLD